MESSSSLNLKKQNGFDFLNWVEKVGNKIPHPFILFTLLAASIIIISLVASLLNLEVIDPTKQTLVKAKNLLSREGINFILSNTIRNFTGFSPLGLVLVMTLGIGLAEHVGLISTLMRHTILNTSPKLITFMIMLIGICGNIASDAAIVVIPVISAMIYLSIGKHPLAGIALGYAATTAGFSANIMVAGTDALLAGISTEAIKMVNPNLSVSITSNWYFMSVSTLFLAIVGTYVSEKIVEPRLGVYTGKKLVENQDVTSDELRGLKRAGINSFIYLAVIFAVAFPQNSVLRDAKTGSLLTSPLMSGIIPLLLVLFLIAGISYGKEVGKIKSASDVPNYMTKSMRDMSSYIVLVFMIGQFVAYFNWSNLGFILAVNGANLLKTIKLSGTPLFITFILLTAFINLFIGSGSAKWALLAPIFVPMFYMMGYSPALTQVLYRVGDSTTNVISPLFPYMPIVLGLAQEYDDSYGVGTVISVMLPYTIAMLIMWIILIIAWIFFGIDLGPGATLFI